MSTKNHEVHDESLELHVVMRHRYSFSARGHCASVVILVTLHFKALGPEISG